MEKDSVHNFYIKFATKIEPAHLNLVWEITAKRLKKMGAVAPTLFGAIKLLVNNQTAISEVATLS